MSIRILLFLIALGAFASCKRSVPSGDVNFGREYFPLTTGHFVEYDVDSFKYNDFTKQIDTFYFDLKDEVGEEFTDNAGRRSFVMHRYKRQDSSFPWTDYLTYYVTETSNTLEVVEDNLRFIKLIFPVKINARWNGNAYLPVNLLPEQRWLSGWVYKYANPGTPHDNGLMQFAESLTVNEVDVVVNDSMDTENYSARTYSREMYAKNVGLIQREQVNWEYQPSTTKYRTGFVLIMRAKNHN